MNLNGTYSKRQTMFTLALNRMDLGNPWDGPRELKFNREREGESPLKGAQRAQEHTLSTLKRRYGIPMRQDLNSANPFRASETRSVTPVRATLQCIELPQGEERLLSAENSFGQEGARVEDCSGLMRKFKEMEEFYQAEIKALNEEIEKYRHLYYQRKYSGN